MRLRVRRRAGPRSVVAELEWLLWTANSPFYAGGESPELACDIAGRCLAATD